MSFSFVSPTPILEDESYQAVLSASGIFRIKEWLKQVEDGAIPPKEICFEVSRIINAVLDFKAAVVSEYKQGEGLISVSEAALLAGCTANSLYIRAHRGDLPDGVMVQVPAKGRKSKKGGYRINIALLMEFLNSTKGGCRGEKK